MDVRTHFSSHFLLNDGSQLERVQEETAIDMKLTTLPLDIRVKIFQELSLLKEMISFRNISQRMRSLSHDIQHWKSAHVWQNFISNSQVPRSEVQTFIKLLKILLTDRKFPSLAKALAHDLFEHATDENLRLFLLHLQEADRKFFFGLINNQSFKRHSLSLIGCDKWFKKTPYDLKWILSLTPHLTELNLSKCANLQDGDLAALEKVPKLTVLSLNHLPKLTGITLIHLTALKTLTHLDLHQCRTLQGKTLSDLTHFTNLTHLNLSELPQLENQNLDFIQALPRLSVTNLSGNISRYSL